MNTLAALGVAVVIVCALTIAIARLTDRPKPAPAPPVSPCAGRGHFYRDARLDLSAPIVWRCTYCGDVRPSGGAS